MSYGMDDTDRIEKLDQNIDLCHAAEYWQLIYKE